VRARKTAAQIESGWADELAAFQRKRLSYVLYP
jgi:hypothetical protein